MGPAWARSLTWMDAPWNGGSRLGARTLAGRGLKVPTARTRQTSLLIWIVALVLVVFAAGSVLWAHAQTSRTQAPPTWFNGISWQQESKAQIARNFALPDQNRKVVSLRQFRGKVAIISFTSSVCRQQCPLVGRTLTTVERTLGPLAKKTVLINISVDPEADTKATVTHFVRKMGWQPFDWYYLWAPRKVMQPIWHSYYVYVPTPPPIYRPGLKLVHTAAVVLVGQNGQVRGYMAWPFLAPKVASGVRDLVEGKA